ncbi:MAG: TPM domain-containing protein [Bacteroidales bacterium]|nr:TPM domain-containing protein [Bacteroidales bacterium]
MKSKLIIPATFLLLLLSSTLGAADVPFLTGRVNDNARILSAGTLSFLGDSLKAHEDRTTNQVVVLTLSTIGGESIEDYANRVFNEWKLGQRGKDNGVLILVVPDDRQMRIEVGYGLEGVLPDLNHQVCLKWKDRISQLPKGFSSVLSSSV